MEGWCWCIIQWKETGVDVHHSPPPCRPIMVLRGRTLIRSTPEQRATNFHILPYYTSVIQSPARIPGSESGQPDGWVLHDDAQRHPNSARRGEEDKHKHSKASLAIGAGNQYYGVEVGARRPGAAPDGCNAW